MSDFNNNNNGFGAGFAPQANGFNGNGMSFSELNKSQGFGGNSSPASKSSTFTMNVDIDNPQASMFTQWDGEKSDIRDENGATLLIVPRRIEKDIPSKKFGGTYTRAFFDYLVLDGPRAGTVCKDSMITNGYLWRDIEKAGEQNTVIVAFVSKSPTDKAPQGAWQFNVVADAARWHEAVRRGREVGLF